MFGLLPPVYATSVPVSDVFPHNGYKAYVQRYAPATSLQMGAIPYMVLPVVIRDDVFRHTSSGGMVQSALGWDIRFETAGGVKRPHEDIWYDSVNGQKAAWVRFDNISSGSEIDLYCYGGKPGLTASEEDPVACWANYLASIEFANGVDKSNNGASLALTGVTATQLAGHETMFNFPSTILFAGLFAVGTVPSGGADAIITSTGDTLITSEGHRIIFFLNEPPGGLLGGALLMEGFDSLLLENGDRFILEAIGNETSDWFSSNTTSVGIIVELENF